MKKIFIDTNILISFLDDKRSDYRQAKKLLSDLMDDNILIVFSEDILTNVVYNSKGLRKQAVEMFDFMNNSQTFIISPFGKHVINKSNSYYLSQGIFTNKGDYEDILQYFCALQNNCERIYTNDKSNFPKLDLPLYDSKNEVFYTPKKDKNYG